MKKTVKVLLAAVIVLSLFACEKKQEKDDQTDPEIIQEEYIDPVRDIFIFDKLDPTLKNKAKAANGNKDLQNYQFKMLFKEAYDGQLFNLNGDPINLTDYDQFLLEVASIECSHCRKMLHIIEAFKAETDIPIIQYFNVGDVKQIRKIYEEEGLEISDEQIIIGHDDGLKAYLKNCGIKAYPTLSAFNNHKISFVAQGETDLLAMRKVLDLGFNEPITEDDLKDAEGNNYLDLSRSTDDVKKDISKENLYRLEKLDNDDYTVDLTLRLIGKKADFGKALNPASNAFINEVEDFGRYEEKKLILLYTYLKDAGDVEKINFINELIEGDQDNEYVLVLVEGFESVSTFVKEMPVRVNCPMISTLAALPEDLYGFGIVDYPTAVFIDKGTITGAYSHVEDKERFLEAIDLFLSEGSIAYKKNNQIVNGK